MGLDYQPKPAVPLQPTTIPRTAQQAFGQLTPSTPEYAPTPAMALPSPQPVGAGGGYVPTPTNVPQAYQGQSADVMSGVSPGPVPGPQYTTDPMAFAQALRQIMQRLRLTRGCEMPGY